MTVDENVRAGRLQEAMLDLQAQVRKQPADPRLRVLLFQLLVVLGQWERALAQLKVAADLDPLALTMMQTYKEALQCEALRAEIFAGRRTPLLFGQPEEWMAVLLQALQLAASRRFDEAAALRERAFEDAPATVGQIDGQPFAWLADADTRLGPMLEAIVNGRYYWIPLARLREIKIEKAADLRDLVWMPAHLTFANGGDTVALIPTRYPGTEGSSDSRLLMARSTEWTEQPGNSCLGIGQRMFATDQGEYALMDVRLIQLQPAARDLASATEAGVSSRSV